MLSRATSRPRHSADHVLALLIFILAVFGLVMISSVSVYESHQVYVRMGTDCSSMDVNCNDFYFWRQARNLLVAFPLWFIAAQIPYLLWRRAALPFFAIAWLLVIALFVPGLAADYGTSRSWLAIPILNSIQPGELVKMALIFYFARWMERRSEEIGTWENGFLPFAVILGLVAVPLILQPDFGMTLVVSIVATAIYFAAGANWRHIAIGGLSAMILAFIAVNALGLDYVKNRFAAWLDPSLDPEGIGFQVKQSLIAVGKGGFFGQGLEGATQRFGYLPEVQSDNIYAATSEAFGFLGSFTLVLIYLAIAHRGFKIAAGAPDRFGKLAAVGLSSALVGQAFVHIGVNIALLPLTGITLPFVSYGGSSLVVSFVMAGILLNISKHSQMHDAEHYRDVRAGIRRR